MLKRLAEAWRTKWDGRWHFEARDSSFHHKGGGVALVFAVAPAKILTFGKGNFSHTRHRFRPPARAASSGCLEEVTLVRMFIRPGRCRSSRGCPPGHAP